MISTARKHWPFTVGVATSVLGVVIVLLGWNGAANTTVLQYQLPYIISGGILGGSLIVLGGIYQVGYALWWQQQRSVTTTAAGGDGDPALRRRLGLGPQPGGPKGPDDNVLAIAGGASYHLESCRVAEGKSAERMTPAAARRAGLRPCRICQG